MSFKLLVFNPSPYPRRGHITMPWQPIYERSGIEPSQLMLRDEAGVPLPFQVDAIDKTDPSKTTLSFTLVEPLQPGHEDYPRDSPSALITGEKLTRPEFPPLPEPRVDKNRAGENVRVTLKNHKPLLVRFNLLPAPDDPEQSWYAGSATSVRIDNQEILDYNLHNPLGHDHEKRSMQLDYIQLPCAAWDESLYQPVQLFNKPYQLVSTSVGPVRANATVASNPFPYLFKDPGARVAQKLECRLFRSLSLFADADYLIEELYVEGKFPDDDGTKVRLHFEAHYFSYLHLQYLDITRFDDIPDWFAAINLEPPFHGYGFAVDVHTQWVRCPHPGYQIPEREGNTFSWLLGPAKTAKCLHLYMRLDDKWNEGEDFYTALPRLTREARNECDSRSGKAWYEHIYKPLRAELS